MIEDFLDELLLHVHMWISPVPYLLERPYRPRAAKPLQPEHRRSASSERKLGKLGER